MTDNLPAVRQTTEVATADTDSWVEVMRPVIALAERISDTQFVPKGLRGSAPATAAAMLYGREVGLPPMTALSMTHVVDGTPGISAEGMRALVLAAGHELEFTETTGAICTMRARRRGAENWTTLSWTIDMARAANLAGKDNWKHYPRRMLQARATSELCEMVFPDVIHGFKSVEDLEDLAGPDDDAPAVLTSRTTVTRAGKKTAAKKTAAAPLELGQRPTGPAGPPLPGEDGYESAEPGKTSAPSDDGDSSSHEEPTGDDQEDGADVAAGEGDEATVEETTDTADPVSGTEEPGEGEGEAPDPGGTKDRGPRMSTRAQHRMIFGLLEGLDVLDEDRHDFTGRIIGRPVASFNDLTHANASAIIDTLGRTKTRPDLDELLAAADEIGPES